MKFLLLNDFIWWCCQCSVNWCCINSGTMEKQPWHPFNMIATSIFPLWNECWFAVVCCIWLKWLSRIDLDSGKILDCIYKWLFNISSVDGYCNADSSKLWPVYMMNAYLHLPSSPLFLLGLTKEGPLTCGPNTLICEPFFFFSSCFLGQSVKNKTQSSVSVSEFPTYRFQCWWLILWAFQ